MTSSILTSSRSARHLTGGIIHGNWIAKKFTKTSYLEISMQKFFGDTSIRLKKLNNFNSNNFNTDDFKEKLQGLKNLHVPLFNSLKEYITSNKENQKHIDQNLVDNIFNYIQDSSKEFSEIQKEVIFTILACKASYVQSDFWGNNPKEQLMEQLIRDFTFINSTNETIASLPNQNDQGMQKLKKIQTFKNQFNKLPETLLTIHQNREDFFNKIYSSIDQYLNHNTDMKNKFNLDDEYILEIYKNYTSLSSFIDAVQKDDDKEIRFEAFRAIFQTVKDVIQKKEQIKLKKRTVLEKKSALELKYKNLVEKSSIANASLLEKIKAVKNRLKEKLTNYFTTLQTKTTAELKLAQNNVALEITNISNLLNKIAGLNSIEFKIPNEITYNELLSNYGKLLLCLNSDLIHNTQTKKNAEQLKLHKELLKKLEPEYSKAFIGQIGSFLQNEAKLEDVRIVSLIEKTKLYEVLNDSKIITTNSLINKNEINADFKALYNILLDIKVRVNAIPQYPKIEINITFGQDSNNIIELEKELLSLTTTEQTIDKEDKDLDSSETDINNLLKEEVQLFEKQLDLIQDIKHELYPIKQQSNKLNLNSVNDLESFNETSNSNKLEERKLSTILVGVDMVKQAKSETHRDKYLSIINMLGRELQLEKEITQRNNNLKIEMNKKAVDLSKSFYAAFIKFHTYDEQIAKLGSPKESGFNELAPQAKSYIEKGLTGIIQQGIFKYLEIDSKHSAPLFIQRNPDLFPSNFSTLEAALEDYKTKNDERLNKLVVSTTYNADDAQANWEESRKLYNLISIYDFYYTSLETGNQEKNAEHFLAEEAKLKKALENTAYSTGENLFKRGFRGVANKLDYFLKGESGKTESDLLYQALVNPSQNPLRKPIAI